MERAADIQRQAAPCPGSKRQLGSFIDSGLVAANDQLAGAVVVADLHNAFVGGCIAACLQGGFVQPQNGCHPAGAPRRSRSHCLTAEGG